LGDFVEIEAFAQDAAVLVGTTITHIGSRQQLRAVFLGKVRTDLVAPGTGAAMPETIGPVHAQLNLVAGMPMNAPVANPSNCSLLAAHGASSDFP